MLNESDLTSDQRKVVEFFKRNSAAIAWCDVGTGKTVSLLTVLLWLINGFDARRILVVGPRLVVERVWSEQVAEWTHLRGLKVVRVVGTAKQRLAALATEADIYTISRDNVQWLEGLYIRITGTDSKGKPVRAQYNKWPFDTVILDESQSFKDQSSKRYKSMRRLRRLVSRIYLLSGSLMPNGYKDLWAQMYLVDGGARLGASEKAFQKRWFRKEVNDGVVTYDLLPGAAEEIDRLVSDVCMVMRDAKQAKPINFVKVTLSKPELQAYRTLVRKNVLELGSAQINAINAGVLWGKLLQLANGAVYDAERQWHVLHDRKLDALVELLESLPKKVLIGYSFVHDIERIQAALAKAKVPGVGVIRTPKSLDDWKAGRITRGIIHPLSAGHGLNDLKDAEAIVWYGLTPNRESFDQLNGRVVGGHRLQGRDIGIHVILADNTIDDDLVDLLAFKGNMQTTAQIRVAQRFVNACQTPAG